jgi:hypothetical protein
VAKNAKFGFEQNDWYTTKKIKNKKPDAGHRALAHLDALFWLHQLSCCSPNVQFSGESAAFFAIIVKKG